MARSLVPITSEHDCRRFKCGKHPLDAWLIRRALQNQNSNVSRTRVLIEDERLQAIGFYSLAATILELESLPQDLRELIGLRYPAPAILLAQLAVHRDHHHQGIGKALLAHALQTASEAADRIGAMAVAVDAIDKEAQNFYIQFGFRPLKKEGQHLFLPFSAIPRNRAS